MNGKEETAYLRRNMEGEDVSIHIHEEQSYEYDGKYSKERGITVKELLDPQGQYHPWWNKIFLFWCVLAVSLDPLFFYTPLINKEKQCLGKDERLMKWALVLRSIMDMTYIMHIIFRIRSGFLTDSSESSKGNSDQRNKNMFSRSLEVFKRISWWYILIDVLAVLPIPQVVMLKFFFKMKGSKSLNTRKWLNVFILGQYVPRILRIFLSCKELARNLHPREFTGTSWVKGAFNFFLYILASHVLGAFWYLFSVQRETACWQHACKMRDECTPTTFFCDDDNKEGRTFLNSMCSTDPLNPKLFDFGIFLDALQSGILGSTDLPRKFLFCFWWGLRNICSFGSNLETSTYAWETLFAVFISIIGLLLFIYLIGNLQTYLQLAAKKSVKVRSKMQTKEDEINSWILKNGIPKDIKKEIMKNAKHKLPESNNVNVVNILRILPSKSKRGMKQFLCFPILKRVPQLHRRDERLLNVIVKYLKPVIFKERSYIIREGEPLDQMLLFTQGTVWTYTASSNGTTRAATSSSTTSKLQKGDFFGEELLIWGAMTSSSPFLDLPFSRKTVKTHTKVEAFALMAAELSDLADTYWWLFGNVNPHRQSSTHKRRMQTKAASVVQAAWRRHH